MIVGDDITVRADDHTAAAPLLLTLLGHGVFIAKEKAEERVDALVLLAALNRHLYINNGLHGTLCRVGEVRIVGFCQIDSAVFHGIAGSVLYDGYGLGKGLGNGCLYHAECGEATCQNG